MNDFPNFASSFSDSPEESTEKKFDNSESACSTISISLSNFSRSLLRVTGFSDSQLFSKSVFIKSFRGMSFLIGDADEII